jgi:hypothetical protein
MLNRSAADAPPDRASRTALPFRPITRGRLFSTVLASRTSTRWREHRRWHARDVVDNATIVPRIDLAQEAPNLEVNTDDRRYLPAYIGREKQMRWIILFWTSSVSVLFAISIYVWRDLFKTERVVRPYLDDIPFQPNRYRHND